jgi:hypothetical protein
MKQLQITLWFCLLSALPLRAAVTDAFVRQTDLKTGQVYDIPYTTPGGPYTSPLPVSEDGAKFELFARGTASQEPRHAAPTPRTGGRTGPGVAVGEEEVQVTVRVHVPDRHAAAHRFREESLAGGTVHAIEVDAPPSGHVREGEAGRGLRSRVHRRPGRKRRHGLHRRRRRRPESPCRHTRGMDSGDIQALIQRTAEVRGVDAEKLEGYRKMIAGFHQMADTQGWLDAWSARQVYIALGNLLTSAALLGIDTCPLEGIDPARYDTLLGLSGYTTLCAVAVGYRAADDAAAGLPKVRFPHDRVVEVR